MEGWKGIKGTKLDPENGQLSRVAAEPWYAAAMRNRANNFLNLKAAMGSAAARTANREALKAPHGTSNLAYLRNCRGQLRDWCLGVVNCILIG